MYIQILIYILFFCNKAKEYFAFFAKNSVKIDKCIQYYHSMALMITDITIYLDAQDDILPLKLPT